jgi:hypothetical protein
MFVACLRYFQLHFRPSSHLLFKQGELPECVEACDGNIIIGLIWDEQGRLAQGHYVLAVCA